VDWGIQVSSIADAERQVLAKDQQEDKAINPLRKGL